MTKEKGLPLTSTHWGTYRAKVKNGKVQELIGWEHDKDPSPIGPGILDVQHGPTRIDSPMVRKSWLENGPGNRNELRGIDPFIEISWDKAETLVAEELNRVKNNFGNSSIFGGSYGWASAGRFHHAQSQLHRFLNCIGGYTRSKFTYSFAAAEAMVPHILGSYRAYLDTCTSWDLIKKHTKLFVCFGGVPIKNSQICQGGTGNHYQRESLIDAGNNGIEFINISPLKSDLIDFISRNKLGHKVKLMNFVENPFNLIKQTDLFILSSKYEGLPNVLLEALVLNKFIISSNCSTGPKEILLNGKGGLLFKIGNYKELSKQIQFYTKNKKKCKNMLKFATNNLNRFDYNKNLEKYYNLVYSVK